jgi:hypothetical protein
MRACHKSAHHPPDRPRTSALELRGRRRPVADDRRRLAPDSVPEGPGINDHGSGAATDLETAIQIAKLGLTPRRALRFGFWGRRGGELLGPQHYVDTLGAASVFRRRPVQRCRGPQDQSLRAMKQIKTKAKGPLALR